VVTLYTVRFNVQNFFLPTLFVYMLYMAHRICSDSSFTVFNKANAITGSEDSRKLRIPDLEKIGKVVNPTHRPPLPPSKYSWYLFLSEAESTPRIKCGRKDYINGTIGNGTRHLPACRKVPRPNSPPRALVGFLYSRQYVHCAVRTGSLYKIYYVLSLKG
jgi:hypothetical protein